MIKPNINKKAKGIIYVFILMNIGLIITGVLVNIKVKCLVCHEVPYLPINDVELGILGVSSNILLGVLLNFSNIISLYLTLFFSALLSGFSTFLQIGRYILSRKYCPYCLLSTITFYVLFGILLYYVILKPFYKKINGNPIQI